MFMKYLYMWNQSGELLTCETETLPFIAIKGRPQNVSLMYMMKGAFVSKAHKGGEVTKVACYGHPYFTCQFPIENCMQFVLIAPTVLVDIVFNNGKCNRVMAQKWPFSPSMYLLGS